VHLIARVIDISFDRRADQRPTNHAVADRHLSRETREVCAHLRKIHAARAGRVRRPGHHLFERRLTAHDKSANEQRTDLRRLLLRGRVHRNPHLAAIHPGIHIGEAKQRAGIVSFEKDHLVIVARSHTQISVERSIAADLARHGKGANVAATARHFQVEATQRLAVMAGHRAELHIKVEVDLFRLVLVGGRTCHR